MPQRHGRGPPPLFHDGRMFVEGIDALRAVDAYNGRNLWEFALPGVLTAFSADHLSGTAVTGSNFCVAAAASMFTTSSAATGSTPPPARSSASFPPPPTPTASRASGATSPATASCCSARWPIRSTKCALRMEAGRHERPVERIDDASSRSTPRPASCAGGTMPRHSIRHNAIAIGGGQVFLIDRPVADEDKWDPKNAAAKLPPVTKVNQPPGRIVALDAATGKLLWKSEPRCLRHDAGLQPAARRAADGLSIDPLQAAVGSRRPPGRVSRQHRASGCGRRRRRTSPAR